MTLAELLSSGVLFSLVFATLEMAGAVNLPTLESFLTALIPTLG